MSMAEDQGFMQAWPEDSLSVVLTFSFSHSLIAHKHTAVPASTFQYGLQHFCDRVFFNRRTANVKIGHKDFSFHLIGLMKLQHQA